MTTESLQLYLIDPSLEMVDAWRGLFRRTPVHVEQGDWTQQDADAVLLPVVSNGDVDMAHRPAAEAAIGPDALQAVDQVVFNAYYSEMHAAQVEVVPSPGGRWPYIVAACTRHFRRTLSAADDSGRVFESALRAVAAFNARQPERQIRSLVSPSIAAEKGEYSRVAAGMYVAYEAAQSVL